MTLFAGLFAFWKQRLGLVYDISVTQEHTHVHQMVGEWLNSVSTWYLPLGSYFFQHSGYMYHTDIQSNTISGLFSDKMLSQKLYSDYTNDRLVPTD